MNFTKLLKMGLVAVVVSMGVGCTTVGGALNKSVNKAEEGILYGVGAISSESTAEKACKEIKNNDERCKNAENYHLVLAVPKFGFASAAWGAFVLVEKNHKDIGKLNFKGRFGDKNAPYIKVKTNKGKFGNLIEVVSLNGDGKCKWSGMPRAGGVVCPAYGYDYRKDFKGVDF